MTTRFCSLKRIGSGETVFQPGETTFVVDCKVNPAGLVAHVRITDAPDLLIVSGGAGNDILNTVPAAELPPPYVVPKSLLPDKNNPE